MSAIDFLRNHELNAEPLPGERLYIWPSENITPELRTWIKGHKAALLRELAPANDDRRMAWRILCDGKPLATLVGRLYSREEAIEAARSRWPNWNIEVTAND